MKKKNSKLTMYTKVKTIVYDDDNMAFYDMIVDGIDYAPEIIDCTTRLDNSKKYIVGISPSYTLTGNIDDTNEIELDPNTMRRIARYNKEKELQRIQKQIENAKSKLEEVTKELNKQNDRLNSVKDYIAKFIKSNENDFGEFVYDEYHNYDDYDWD